MGTATVAAAEARGPRTLQEAHDDSYARMPGRDAPVSAWVAFRRANARMYRAVADLDRGHHHEALYWFDRERREVESLTKKPEWKSDYGREGVEAAGNPVVPAARLSEGQLPPLPDVGFGVYLRAARERKSLSLTAVAAKAKIGKSTLQAIEVGSRRPGSLEVIAALADALGEDRAMFALLALRVHADSSGGDDD
ncbi:helix-turn-helix transcriptional regulator [Amycolatopsis saalfeldensis]|uniref:helix-turn-helix transcriptional regulator n=1 Tax=Amycolatopsis saalfeldensis TaxID=394193 RepID=UPI003184440B